MQHDQYQHKTFLNQKCYSNYKICALLISIKLNFIQRKLDALQQSSLQKDSFLILPESKDNANNIEVIEAANKDVKFN